MQDTFTMYAIVGNEKGEYVQVANLRRWTTKGSDSISDTYTGKVYGKGSKAWKAACADSLAMNIAENPQRPDSIPMHF